MSRIERTFNQLKEKNKKALVIYITAGDPDIETTKSLVIEIAKQGPDIIELGVPFSDPVADGPTIQKASLRALKSGTTLKKVIKLVKDIRQTTQIPIILMGYYNPIYKYGRSDFISHSLDAGIDGIIIPDLPPDEDNKFVEEAEAKGLDTIFLLAPTSPEERIKLVAEKSKGFIYYVSLTGVTGARDKLAKSIKKNVNKIKSFTNLPVAVGFGISNPEQAKEISSYADGVVIGSAVIKIIEANMGSPGLISKISQFVKGLKEAM